MDKLPLDVANLMLDKVPICDTPLAAITLSKTSDKISREVEDLEYNRKNPIKLFSQISNNPYRFMKSMVDTRSILSGSRALNYFVPGSCDENSDWDFYCTKLNPRSEDPKHMKTSRLKQLKSLKSLK